MKRLVAYNLSVLEKLDGILSQLDSEAISTPYDLLFGSTIGQHFRHILEFYECLLAGLPACYFSYDRRKRNLMIETDVLTARLSIRNSIAGLAGLTTDLNLTMDSELPGEPEMVSHQTTLSRELAYVADHGVHHLAIIRIALEQFYPQVVIDGNVGVAASTINYRNR